MTQKSGLWKHGLLLTMLFGFTVKVERELEPASAYGD